MFGHAIDRQPEPADVQWRNVHRAPPPLSEFGAALKSSSEPVVVRSAFDLRVTQRAAIQNALNETFSAEIHIRCETSPDLISGIELTANGQKVAWSIADYLASLGKGVDELLKKNDEVTAAGAKAETTPKVAETKAGVKTEPKPEAKPEGKAEPKLKAPKPETVSA